MTRCAGMWACLALCFLSGCQLAPPEVAGPLEPVAMFGERRVTGVGVSSDGRVFVCFPLWETDDYAGAVAEVMDDGSVVPYPDSDWNSWRPAEGNDAAASRVPLNRFICVQSVVVDDRDTLWVLDPAAPGFEGPLPGGAKLVAIDLATDRIKRVYRFGPDAAPPGSYLNDVRIDPERRAAYITDSGKGALVVVDLDRGTSRRLLAGHPSTQADPAITPLIEGRPLLGPDGQPPRIHADGIALSPDGHWLYYHALTGTRLFRVPTALLRNPETPAERLADAVEDLGPDDLTDGMLMDAAGYLYLTGLQRNAILVREPDDNELTRLIADDRLDWPDTLAMQTRPDGGRTLYITTSRIHEMPAFNEGQDHQSEPTALWALPLTPVTGGD